MARTTLRPPSKRYSAEGTERANEVNAEAADFAVFERRPEIGHRSISQRIERRCLILDHHHDLAMTALETDLDPAIGPRRHSRD